MLLSSTFMLLAFASSIAATPSSLWKRAQVVLGYRTVNKDEAAKINAAGTLVWDSAFFEQGTQLLWGIYTSPGTGKDHQGEFVPTADEWICVVKCDQAALDRVSKCWIPEKWNGVTLWWSPDDEIDQYINLVQKSWNPAKTILMSEVDGDTDRLQLLIPPALVAPDGGMGITAECHKTIAELPTTAVVNYDSWQNNIGGSRKSGSTPRPPVVVPHFSP